MHQRLRLCALFAALSVATQSALQAAESESRFEQGLAAYQDGNGLAAGEFWEPCARDGDARCQYALGVLFDDGAADWPADIHRALRWFRRAARQDHLNAQIRLGFIYAVGREGVAQSIETAYVWFSIAAANGSEAARTHRQRVTSLMTEQEIARGNARLTEESIRYHQQ